MEGERPDGQGQLLCGWTADRFLRDGFLWNVSTVLRRLCECSVDVSQ